jgi:hypothetical protein
MNIAWWHRFSALTGVLDGDRGGIDLLDRIGGHGCAQAARSCSKAPHSQRVRRLTSGWSGR